MLHVWAQMQPVAGRPQLPARNRTGPQHCFFSLPRIKEQPASLILSCPSAACCCKPQITHGSSNRRAAGSWVEAQLLACLRGVTAPQVLREALVFRVLQLWLRIFALIHCGLLKNPHNSWFRVACLSSLCALGNYCFNWSNTFPGL